MRSDLTEENQIVVGLDIGTTKICAVVAQVGNQEELDILGVGHAKSDGLTKGVITNISSAVKSIRKAIDECQLKSGLEIDNVFAGIAGHHIQGVNSEGVVAVSGQTITESDIQRVIESARAFSAPDKEILHTLSQEYIVDGQDGVKDPIGMAGKRLEAKVHIVLGSITSATNIVQCCHEAQLNVANVVLEPLASSLAVLETEEKELGSILLDIGGGTSDMVIFKNGSIVHTAVLPLGGNQITNDIAVGLRTPRSDAIRIKHDEGVALRSMVEEEVIHVVGISGRADRIVDKHLLAEVIEARFSEIFYLIKDNIEKSGYGPTSTTGVVLTGGSSLLSGLDVLAEQVLKIPVRIGIPSSVTGLDDLIQSPMYATSVGLVKYGIEHQYDPSFLRSMDAKNTFPAVFQSLKDTIKKFF